MISFHAELKRMAACSNGAAWARDYPAAQAAWDACPRGDWMLWWAAKRGVRRQDLVLAACACARLALPYAQGDEAEIAIATAERFVHGDKSVALSDVRVAAGDDDASAWVSALAARSIDATAWSVDDSAWPAHTVARTAHVASDAAFNADSIPREETLRKCADICRRFWKEVP